MRNWRARLTPFQQRIYDRSASIPSIQFTPTSQLLEATATLENALATEDHSQVESLSQTIVNHICWQLNVRTVRVRVQGVRPSNRRGELHGLYTQYGGGSDSIQVWMRTAKRGKTYLHLRESYHTDGFFQRESSLFRTIVQQPAEEAPRPTQSLSAMVREILAERGQRNGEDEDSEEKG